MSPYQAGKAHLSYTQKTFLYFLIRENETRLTLFPFLYGDTLTPQGRHYLLTGPGGQTSNIGPSSQT